MPRKLRVQYPGALYHLMNRGDRREDIFEDDQDRQRLLETLGQTCEKTGWQVHAYCLMSNHFHLMVETPQPNLVAGMKWLLGTYTGRFNRRHKEFKEELLAQVHARRGDHYGPELREPDKAYAQGVTEWLDMVHYTRVTHYEGLDTNSDT